MQICNKCNISVPDNQVSCPQCGGSDFYELVEQLRLSCKTYELFAVARLFLGKPERFAMVVKKKDGCADKNLYLTTDDGFVFRRSPV